MKEINGTEKRFPRESFTKKLIKICERLDKGAKENIPWNNKYLNKSGIDLITIEKLWVVGSYSRGALSCGDLDLVFTFTYEDRCRVYTDDVVRGFFGRVPYASFYHGDPDVNTSGVPFPDAVEIWSGHGCDWQKAIDSITPDPAAGRAYRPHDDIPLRLAQLNTSHEEADEIVQMLKDGILESEFIPFTKEVLEPLPNDDELSRFTSSGSHSFGVATKRILPGISRLIGNNSCNDMWRFPDRSRLEYEGTQVIVGKPFIPYSNTFDDLSVKQVAMVPHLSAKGPNGIWILRRGPNHPVIKSFDDKKAFIITIDGKPGYIINEVLYDSNLLSIDIFRSSKSAKACLNNMIKAFDPDDIGVLSIEEVSGKELHHIVSGCDFVYLDEDPHAFSYDGEREIRGGRCSAAEFVSNFKDIEEKPSLKKSKKKRTNDRDDSYTLG